MCCVRTCVSVRGSDDEGAELHQQPIFIFIIYNYLAISNRGRGGGGEIARSHWIKPSCEQWVRDESRPQREGKDNMFVNVQLSVSWLCLVKRRRKLGGTFKTPPPLTHTGRDTAVWLKLYNSNNLDFSWGVTWPQPPLGSLKSLEVMFWSDSRASSVLLHTE